MYKPIEEFDNNKSDKDSLESDNPYIPYFYTSQVPINPTNILNHRKMEILRNSVMFSKCIFL